MWPWRLYTLECSNSKVGGAIMCVCGGFLIYLGLHIVDAL
jgi:hypothetical protein